MGRGGELKTTKMGSLIVLEKPQTRVLAGAVLSGFLEGESGSCLSPGFWLPTVLSSQMHHANLGLHLHMVFPLPVSVSFLLSFIRTLVIGFRAHPNLQGSHLEILTSMISAMTLIPNNIILRGCRWTYLEGGAQFTHYRDDGRATSSFKSLVLSEHENALVRRIRQNDGHEPALGTTWSSWDRYVVLVLSTLSAEVTHYRGQKPQHTPPGSAHQSVRHPALFAR